MKVRAIAARAAKSNAIGTVELECTPSGLVLDYLGMGAFAEGYAPGALTRGTQVVVPWSGVEQARVEGDRVWLELDRARTPLNRMSLVRFSSGDDGSTQDAKRRRLVLWLGVATAVMLIVLLLIALRPLWGQGRGGTAIGLALAVSSVLLGIGLTADRQLTRRPDEHVVREHFVIELEQYLPKLLRLDRPPPLPKRELSVKELQGLLPRSTSAVIITLSACGLAALITSHWMMKEPERTARASAPPARAEVRIETLAASPPPAAALPPTSASAATLPAPTSPEELRLGADCKCERPHSILWDQPIPRLSTLLIEQRKRAHKSHLHTELELGIVNNGHEPIGEVTLRVQFYEDNPNDKSRRPTKDRPLFFEGPLGPGKAIKWHVEARGTSFEVTAPDLGVLGLDGEGSASADQFADLLNANHRPVRLHGAMMLSLLGDERAKEGAAKLREALREQEAPYLDRVLRSQRPIKSCDLDVTGQSANAAPQVRIVRACVFNASDQALDRLGVQARALNGSFDHQTPLAPPPVVVADKVWNLGVPLEPKSGRMVTVSLDTKNIDGLSADIFEVLADSKELLQTGAY